MHPLHQSFCAAHLRRNIEFDQKPMFCSKSKLAPEHNDNKAVLHRTHRHRNLGQFLPDAILHDRPEVDAVVGPVRDGRTPLSLRPGQSQLPLRADAVGAGRAFVHLRRENGKHGVSSAMEEEEEIGGSWPESGL